MKELFLFSTLKRVQVVLVEDCAHIAMEVAYTTTPAVLHLVQFVAGLANVQCAQAAVVNI